MKNLAVLAGAPIALWLLLLYPGWLWWGDAAFLHSGVALALCLTPAVVTYVAILRYAKSADARMLAALAASGVRLAVSLGVGLLLHAWWGDLFPAVFLYWLLVFYLVILGLEVGLLTRRSPVS